MKLLTTLLKTHTSLNSKKHTMTSKAQFCSIIEISLKIRTKIYLEHFTISSLLLFKSHIYLL